MQLTSLILRAASAGMVLLNKVALSSFGFHSPNALLLFQCSVCAALVQVCGVLTPLQSGSQLVDKTPPPARRLYRPGGVCTVVQSELSSPDPPYLICVPMPDAAPRGDVWCRRR